MSGVDQRQVEEISRALAARDRSLVDRLFSRQRGELKSLVWEPDLVDLENLQLGFLLSFWRRLSEPNVLPPATLIDPLDLRPALGIIVLVDAIDDGRDFRYRLVGTEVASRYGTDMTGRHTSEIDGGGHIAAFYLAQYRAVLDLKHPLYSRHFSPRNLAVSTWDRLLLPFANDAGDVIRIMVGQTPSPLRNEPGAKRREP